ncbi:YceI family protein [Albibacterium indicum]|uniref:YceI family protein n=1 Tax=Albibacterium indicum TaxID=2292082 RepID=UPI00197F60BE|nr:YceI family protein [Pedobacter indicus]
MATKWALDPTHSEVNFKVKHLVISTVSGHFRSFDGTVESNDEADFESAKVAFSIDAASVDTNQQQRDDHLRSADFFDVENFPSISFVSTSVRAMGNEEFVLEGDLTVKDITKKIELNAEYGGSVTDAYGNFKVGFEVTGKINRKDFGLVWNAVTEAGSVVVGDRINIQASVQFIKQ